MVPVYQAEIVSMYLITLCPCSHAQKAPKEIRGRVVSLQQWAITWGILIQYFIQYGSSFVGGGAANPKQSSAAFRIPWAVQTIPAAILFVGMFFMPFTPRWLAGQDRWEESIRVLANLHGNGDIGHPKVLAQYREIEEALRFEREEAVSSLRALTEPKMFSRVILGMSIQMWSQLCGINILVSELTQSHSLSLVADRHGRRCIISCKLYVYSAQLVADNLKLCDASRRHGEPSSYSADPIHLERCPYPPRDSLSRHCKYYLPHAYKRHTSSNYASWGQLCYWRFRTCNSELNQGTIVDSEMLQWGRRPSLLVGAFGQMACLFIIGALEAIYGEPNPHTNPDLDAISWVTASHPVVSRLIIAFSYLFVSIFAMTWGPTSWVYAAEIFPTGIRAKAVSLTTASNWAWNCAVGFAVPPLLWSINWKMYMIFGTFNLFAFVHIWVAAPETKGKTLEEMTEVFDSGRPAWERRGSGSRLDRIQKDIEDGNLKVLPPEESADRH